MRNIIIFSLIMVLNFASHAQTTNQAVLVSKNIGNRNKEIVRILLADAMPNGRFDVIKKIVSKDCVTNRAGFKNLFSVTGAAIPQNGNFLNWVETGWKPLSEALSDQHVEINDIVGDSDKVMIRYHMTALHKGKFVGVPGSGRTVEWDEVASIRFDSDGKIIELWFMCEELKMALELGLTLKGN